MRARGVGAGAAAVLALGGCGLADAVPLGGGPPATDARLLVVTSQIVGTPGERRARDYLEYVTVQARVASCASTGGTTYQPLGFLDPSGGVDRDVLPDPVPAAALASVERARTHGLGADVRVRARRQQAAAQSSVPTAGGGTSSSVRDACAQSATEGVEGVPDFARALSEDFTRLASDAADRAGVKGQEQKYLDCVRSSGATLVDERLTMDANADQLYQDLRPGTPEWDAARQKEIQLAVADAECRADDHARYLKALGPLLADFEKAHASEIVDVDKQWGELPAKAQRAQAAFRKAHPTTAPAVDFTG